MPRVLIGKAGLDGHDRGAKIIARVLRDSGFEVIYTGLHQTPESIVKSAIEEDVDGLGLSILSGAHMSIFSKVVSLLRKQKIEDIVLFGGGIIPDDDIKALGKLGIQKIFTPGASTEDIVDWAQKHITSKTLDYK